MEFFGYWDEGEIIYIGSSTAHYNAKLKIFEKKLSNWYPLGDDFFTIDHGKNYFAFFERLGEINYQICLNKNEVVAGLCGILRKIVMNENHNFYTKVWYLCDLKVLENYRNKRLPAKMAKKTALFSYLKAQRGYAVSMNPTGTRILKLAQKFNKSIKSGGNLLIYSLNYGQITRVHNLLKSVWGDIKYLSLNGVKDLLFKNTNKPMKILHLQHGYTKLDGFDEPLFDYTCMLCCHENDKLVNILKSFNITTNISATIIHYNMDESDWKFILTSDI